LDNELYAKTEKKMVDVMKQSGMSWIEAKFMENAVDELTKCRNTLKWSYAMAFFLQTGKPANSFLECD
jgi:ariadne-1